MKKFFLFILSTFTFFSTNAQLSAIIVDKNTKNSISYANIWCDNGKLGTTATVDGKFYLTDNYCDKITITAVGFKRKELDIKTLRDTIFLEEDYINLREVKIFNKQKLKFKLGKVKNTLYEVCVVNDYSRRTIAKFFPNKLEIEQPLFVRNIELKTYAILKNTFFNIQFFSVNENGEPNELIYTKNILCKVKSGTNTTKIDVSDLDIELPKKGIFIAIENLLVDENKLEVKYQPNLNSAEYVTVFIFEPRIKMLENEGNEDTWTYNGETWRKNDKGKTLSMSITITD